MIRLEGKFPGEHIVEMADELGHPADVRLDVLQPVGEVVAVGRRGPRVAQDSLRSQILMLRSHPSAFIWANGSDGKPPPDVLGEIP